MHDFRTMADPRIRRAEPSVELAVLAPQTFLSATWTLVSATWTGISTTRATSVASRRHINSNQEPHRAKKLHVQKRKSPSCSSGFLSGRGQQDLERSSGVEYRSQRSARQVLGVLGKLVLAARPPALRKK